MFTKLTKDISYIQKLGDLPNDEDGLTADELKKKFDAGPEDLKVAFNQLIDELSLTTASSNIGMGKINTDDTSANNLDAKLKYLHESLVNATMGQVPDNSITQVKIDSSYDATLAKKDGTLQENLNASMINGNSVDNIGIRNGVLQTNLNAEKVGGETLAQILEHKNYTTGTYVGSYNIDEAVSEENPTSQTINIGFTPSIVIIFYRYNSFGSGTEADIYVSFNGFSTAGLTIVENGFMVSGKTLNAYKKQIGSNPYEYGYLALK